MTATQTAVARIVDARRNLAGFADFPGPLPETLDEAYAMQAAEIASWPQPIAGWKVGRITGDDERKHGENRFIGPIFADSVWVAKDAVETDFPIIDGGFAAVEAELVAKIDCPALTGTISPEEALAMVTAWHIGIEVAGSPCKAVGEKGALASIAAFGNNFGLILGPVLHTDAPDEVGCTVTIGDGDPFTGKAGNLPGGTGTAIAFALNRLHRMGHASVRDCLISTGAITGVHAVGTGLAGSAQFQPGGTIAFRTVTAST
ncbi:2-keto-4-pentenoate hydratase [Croceicoccus sediminis]|uniref:2-keto-4-pentenoate hydratase n=1 Tax=Croceicoccus sediminis TaxID=2571150 RepID=UPI001183B197|nr:2-keto-4-pentenoate hydratase [Croceicoccus sediminis]